MDRLLIRIKRFIPKPVLELLLPLYHLGLAFTGALIYGFPSRGMKVVGITGTSGKTTTTELLYEIFSHAGFPSASLTTLRFKIADRTELNMLKMTMPGRFKIQKLLREAKRRGVKYVFLEVTSEGIKQSRHKFINFYAAIFTNLSEEHLESHGGFENYRRAKLELFRIAPIHILNGDDPNFVFFYRVRVKAKAKALVGSPVRRIVYKMADYPKDLTSKLPGDFNKNNILAAVTFAEEEGISWEAIKRAVESFSGLEGRMEKIQAQGFDVWVDYAFLPQAMEKVYTTLKTLGYKKLIAVTGAAGGGRDKWKRPLVGNVAAKYCAKVYVTNEDPYDEDPMAIINEVAGEHKEFIKILDRREAIREALASAKRGEGDAVVITGKGAEPIMMGPRGEKIPWDDREVAREELEKL